MKLGYGYLLMAALFLAPACGQSPKESASSKVDQTTDTVASKQGAFRVKMEWIKGPVAGSAMSVDNQARLTFYKADGSTPGSVNLTGYHPSMPAMGHGTNEDRQVFEKDATNANVYLVKGIIFIMGGAANSWVVDVEANVDGTADTATVTITQAIGH